LVVPEGIPSQFVVQAYCTTSEFDLGDLNWLCLKYMLLFLSTPREQRHQGLSAFSSLVVRRWRMRICCVMVRNTMPLDG